MRDSAHLSIVTRLQRRRHLEVQLAGGPEPKFAKLNARLNAVAKGEDAATEDVLQATYSAEFAVVTELSAAPTTHPEPATARNDDMSAPEDLFMPMRADFELEERGIDCTSADAPDGALMHDPAAAARPRVVKLGGVRVRYTPRIVSAPAKDAHPETPAPGSNEEAATPFHADAFGGKGVRRRRDDEDAAEARAGGDPKRICQQAPRPADASTRGAAASAQEPASTSGAAAAAPPVHARGEGEKSRLNTPALEMSVATRNWWSDKAKNPPPVPEDRRPLFQALLEFALAEVSGLEALMAAGPQVDLTIEQKAWRSKLVTAHTAACYRQRLATFGAGVAPP